MLKNWKFVVSIVLVLSVASVVVAGKPESGASTGVAPTVYITNGADQIFAVDTVSGALTEIYARDGLVFEGLTYGPDQWLYACTPSNETVLDSPTVLDSFIKIIRFDPTDPYGTVRTLYTATAGDDLEQPQCGEFNHKGDFLVTRKNTVAASEPVVSDSDDTFGGLTQRTNGDLYFVNSTQQAVKTAQMEVYTGDFLGSAASAGLPAFTEPIGVAVSSRDDVFVAEDGRLLGFYYNGSAWEERCTLSFKNQRPFFLDFATTQYITVDDKTEEKEYHDVLFLGVEGKSSGTLAEITVDFNGECTIANKVTIKKPASEFGAAVGVAVPKSYREAKLTFIDDDPADELHNMFNHAMNIFPVPAGCTSEVVANEELPEFVCEKIRKIEFDPSKALSCGGPDYTFDAFVGHDPACTTIEESECWGIDRNPVIYFAEEFGQVYDITGPDCAFPDGLNLAVSFFSQYLRSPQLGFCSNDLTRCVDLDENATECCGVLPLNMYFPNDGAFPRDRTIGGRTDGRSIWFALDDQENPVEPGGKECLCPQDKLYSEADAPESPYLPGDTVPLRIQVLDNSPRPGYTPIDCSTPEILANACQSGSAGDYVVKDMKILLSMARVEGGVFNPVAVEASGNTEVNPPYFSAPNSINASSWTFQLKTPLDPGLYKVVLFFVDREIDFPIAPVEEYGDLFEGGFIERFIYVE
jgi:hypothetical protein